jgi:hypothetical protein
MTEVASSQIESEGSPVESGILAEEKETVTPEGVLHPDLDAGDWKTLLPREIREWDEAKNSDDSEKFWDQIKHQRSLVGQSIRIPGEDAGKEDWEAFHQKLISKTDLIPKPNADDPSNLRAIQQAMGMPETPEQYSVPEDLGDYNGDVIATMKNMAHELGLTQSQYKGLVKRLHDGGTQQAAEMQKEIAESQKVLANEWGHAYDQKVAQIKHVLEQTKAPEGLIDQVELGQVNGETLRWLNGIVEGFGQEGQTISTQPNAAPVMTPMEARTAIDEMMNNSNHPYWLNTHPGHKDAIDRMVELQELANPYSQ